MKWPQKAADRGNAVGQCLLGVKYGAGTGTPSDFAEAAKWFRKAADQGNTNAQYNLGIAHFKGRGVPQDYAIAHMWLNLAAAGGNKDAAEFRDALAAEMTPAQIAEAQRLARERKPGQK